MTGDDYGIVVGLFFAAWAGGYVSGAFFKYVRQIIERVIGASGG